MLKYDKLWVTLKEKNISQYKLIKDYGIRMPAIPGSTTPGPGIMKEDGSNVCL